MLLSKLPVMAQKLAKKKKKKRSSGEPVQLGSIELALGNRPGWKRQRLNTLFT